MTRPKRAVLVSPTIADFSVLDEFFSSSTGQAVLKVTAATEIGGICTLAFPSLIFTVCNGWLQMAFGFS